MTTTSFRGLRPPALSRTEPLRLLVLSNQPVPRGDPGFVQALDELVGLGELESFTHLSPRHLSAADGDAAAREVIADTVRADDPNIILVMTPNGFRHDAGFVRSIVGRDERTVLYWEGDAWGRRGKRVNDSMRAWLAVADVVFSVAGHPQPILLRRAGARDVRLVPHTYCQVQQGDGEEVHPLDDVSSIRSDAVVVGNSLARRGRVSLLPGAVQRASLVRRLERCRDLTVDVYGSGWDGPSARGLIRRDEQIAVIRQSAMSLNWDHFPRHQCYASDRLPISLLAGRVHVTTFHHGLDWLPGPEAGLFMERSPRAVAERARRLAQLPRSELLALGVGGHEWVKGRMSNREAVRYMLAAVRPTLLETIPAEPWRTFAASGR